jgi:glutathione S-transferase
LVGGVFYPTAAAALGALYLASRLSYAAGYATGDPKQRGRGHYGYIGLIGLLGLCTHTILAIARVI